MLNIQKRQIEKKENEIVENILKEGNRLSSFDVYKNLNAFFEYNTPGLPLFKPITLNPHETSDKKVYNTMFKNIYEDLNTAYEVYNDASNSSLIAQNNTDIELVNVYKQLDELSLELEIANKYATEKIAYSPRVITFNTLEYVNTQNLSKYNILESSCEIDFENSMLKNELISLPNAKRDLKNSTMNITTTARNIEITGEISNILEEVNNKNIMVTTSSNSDDLQTIFIDVIFDKKYSVSRIEFSAYYINNSQIKLFTSQDSINYLEKPTKEGSAFCSWSFNAEELAAIKIQIDKTSIDTVEDKLNICYFIINNLSVYLDNYKKTSVYVSNRISFTDIISDIIISPLQETPPNTDIAYFIGLENNKNSVEWKQIKTNTPVDLGLLNKEEMLLTYMTSEYFGMWDFDREMRRYLFYIHMLPDNTNLNSIKLRAGHSQWFVERLDVSDLYKDGIPTDGKVKVTDYNKKRVIGIGPIEANSLEVICRAENNYIVMSQYVLCDEETIIENRFFKFDNSKDHEIFDFIVLVNGKRIFAKNDLFSFKLRKGENIIQIMFLLCNLQTVTEEKKIKHNFNLLPYCDQIFAGPQMERISYNALANSISKFSLKYYAIKEILYNKAIVTKFDPNYILDPEVAEKTVKNLSTIMKDNADVDDDKKYKITDLYVNTSEFFRMYVQFKHLTNEKKATITNEEGNSAVRCRIMARLSTSDQTVSPIIKNIKVVGE